jgi:hypothetical protein
MANLDELALLLQTTLDSSDFLTRLRVKREFDKVTYDQLLTIINDYAQQSAGENMIHKTVASCAFDLLTDVTASAYHVSINNSPQQDELDNAINELLVVLPRLFRQQAAGG